MERNWDYVRTLIASMFNSSGFSKKSVKPIDVMRLSFDDVKPVDASKVEKVDDEFIQKALKII
jgi:preprotein translocase subunit SecB